MKLIAKLFATALLLAFMGSAAAADVSPMTVEGATTVDAAQAKALFDEGAIFIDVRSDKDWAAGRVPDAYHLELKSNYTEATLGEKVAKDQAVVIYCNGENCPRSADASAKAVGWGYSKVYYFRDGLPAWMSAGYPVE